MTAQEPGRAQYEAFRDAVPDYVCNVPAGPWEELPPTVQAGFAAIAAGEPQPASASQVRRHAEQARAADDAHALAAREPQPELAARLREVLLDVAVTPLDARIQALRLLDERPTTAMPQPQPTAEPGSLAARVAAEFAGYEADIASLTEQRNRVSDTADRLRGLLDDFTHAAIDYAGTPIKVRDAAKAVRKKAGLPPVVPP